MPNVFRKELNKHIKVEAFNLGFALCGIIHPNLPLHYHDYIDWVHEGLGNGLAYLTGKHAIRMRQNPRMFSQNARPSLVLLYPMPLMYRAKTFLIASTHTDSTTTTLLKKACETCKIHSTENRGHAVIRNLL